MSQDQIAYMLSQIEKMSNQLDRMREDIGEMKITMAVRQSQFAEIMEDRKILKGKVASLVGALTAIVVALGAWLAHKLGISVP